MYLHLKTFFKVSWFMLFYKKFSFRRFFFFLGFLFFFWLIWLSLVFFRFLDNLFYRKYKKQEIKQPIFIIGNPRSGTTFLYDLIAQDKKRFAQPFLYQSLFCSITLYKMIKFFSSKSKKIKKFLGNRISFANRFFSKFKSIHEIKLDKSEEDEAIFFLNFLSPSVYFICPFVEKIPELTIIDNLNSKTRKKLMNHYKSCIKRFLYEFGNNRTYLCKNVMSTGKIKTLIEAFPDAKIIYPLRHPYKTIPSMVKFYHSAWKLHSPEILKNSKSKETKDLAKSMMEFYKHVLKNKESLNKNLFIVKFEDLISNPEKTIKEVYKKLGIKMTSEYLNLIRNFIKKQKRYQSKNNYNFEELGISEEFIYENLKDVFKEYNFKK
ncbi:MAG: sulfotransferase [Candidatus Pacearchaeota archaeon]|jgi:hypothetical protein